MAPKFAVIFGHFVPLFLKGFGREADTPNAMFVSLIYASNATKPFTPGELVQLLEKSRVNNARRGITGMLLYRDGAFLQAVEGEEEMVRELASIISKDPRHKDFHPLWNRVIPCREFSEWSMGFKDLTRAEQVDIPGANDFLFDVEARDFAAAEGSVALRLLKTFAEIAR